MPHSTTNVHRITAIRVKATSLGSGRAAFISTEFTFVAEDGTTSTVSAFSKDFLQIEGASHVNHIASGEPEPALMGDPDEYSEEESP